MAAKLARFLDLVQADGDLMNAVVSKHLDQMAKDCESRPGDTRPRKLTISIEMKPVVKDGVCGFTDIDWQSKYTPPSQRVGGTRMRVAPGKGLIVNPESADDPNQHTIDELTNPGDAAGGPSADKPGG
jgi:hypothetical protein